MRGITRSLLPLAALALGLAVAPAASAATHPAQDPVPIGPNQYFKGILNGHPPGSAMLFVACTVGSTTGHAVAGQKLWVAKTPPPTSTNPDVGYTGSKGKGVNATLGTPTLTALLAHFTGYLVKVNFPTSITLPCSGKGSITFAPAPTSSTAHSAVLAVTFGPPPVG
jgi:hypothetical protein